MKSALITGASRGLGLALARQLAAEGWQLIIDARGKTALEKAWEELSQLTSIVAIRGDISDELHRKALAEEALRLGGLDAIINNASFLGPSPQPDLLHYPIEIIDQVYQTNVIAPLAIIQNLYKTLKPEACIMNVTSDAAVEPYAGWGGYGSSKAALEHMSNILAKENPDLRVYLVDPGDMRTQMQQEAFPDEDISDKPLPAEIVPALINLIGSRQVSGRYKARQLMQSLV
jgi:NAD(P)-dependent dehydrogenase (short-subunit alcohol dehydrogenase family)